MEKKTQRGREVWESVEAKAEALAYEGGYEVGSKEYDYLLEDVLADLCEEDTEALEAYWQAEEEEERAKAEQGAQICVEYWQSEGEAEMLAEAEARLERIRKGEATEVDIEGALDWLEAQTEDTEAREEAKKQLQENWAELVAKGEWTAEEMEECLQDQIDGYTDLADGDLSEEIAEVLGWDIENISEEQWEEWAEIVNESAREYLAK